MNKNIRLLLAAMALAGAVLPSAAKKITYDITGREATGFNALDLRLQKPLGNDIFPASESSFGHHIFIEAGVGMSTFGNSFSTFAKPGVNATGRLGGWITPLHGIRLTGGGGLLSVHSGVKRAWYGMLGAEYLLNLSALQGGYNPSRRFEVIGAIGAEFNLIRQSGRGEWGKNIGLTAALQVRYNAGPTLYLFAEPKFGYVTGYRYDRPHDEDYRMRANLSLSLGLGYRILQGERRKAGASIYRGINDDDLYFGASAGLGAFPRHSARFKNPAGEVYVGKMFSSESAVQFNMAFARYRRNNYAENSYMGIASVNYVLNLNNACGGYRPSSVFNLLAHAGVSGAMVVRSGKGRSIAPGINAGLTGAFRLSPNWSLTLTPQVYLFSSRFTNQLGISRSPLATMSVGVRYTIGDFSTRFPLSYEQYASANKYFLLVGGGLQHRLRGNFGPGFSGFVGFGKRFTPVSSWRITIDGDVYPRSPMAIAGTVQADYVSSITTAMMGYDPDRLLDMQLSLGVFAGIANYASGLRPTAGISAGLQASFRLTNSLDIFVEPQFRAVSAPNYSNQNSWNPELRVLAGLRYRLGHQDKRGDLTDTPYGTERNFVSLAAGPNARCNGLSNSYAVKGLLDVSVGRWFSRVSALRLSYGSDWFGAYNGTHYVGSVHADYLCNLMALIDANPDRRFHIIAAVGAGVGFSGAEGTSAGPMAYGGVQLRYNLPANIDVHIEPGLNLWANRLLPEGCRTSSRFNMMARLAVGASFRF